MLCNSLKINKSKQWGKFDILAHVHCSPVYCLRTASLVEISKHRQQLNISPLSSLYIQGNSLGIALFHQLVSFMILQHIHENFSTHYKLWYEWEMRGNEEVNTDI